MTIGNSNLTKGFSILAMAVLAFGTAVMGLPLMVQSAYAATPFSEGDVFVSVGNGKVEHYDPDGNFIQTLDSLTPGAYTTGMAFDSDGKLYVTTFNGAAVKVFDTDGSLLGSFGSGYNASPESILFDSAGNAYVGQADGTGDILKFDSTGASLDSFNVATEARGSDWIDLAADQCTMFYTSEHFGIKRYDVCTDTQLTDFATLPGRPAFALRILPTGDVLVADSAVIYRVNTTGAVVQTYDAATENNWFALNLDPDGTSFWSADFGTSKVVKFDIASGAILDSFTTQITGQVFGLAIAGELTVARPVYNLNLFENSDPSDGVIDLGDDARAVADTNDPTVTQVTFRWIDPNSNVDSTTVVPVVSGEAEDTFTPDEVGTWIVEADFGNGVIVQQTLNINFLVIPESPVGIAALVGSSLAALGGYMFLKKRSSTGTTTGLGI
jgi:outer membrane protein assembly factor BamB